MTKVICNECGYIENENSLVFIEGTFDYNGDFFPKYNGGMDYIICGGCGEYLHPDYDVEYEDESNESTMIN
ncbi:MAG: hypothetical protein EPN82_05830 [Bacteroidetes bacterium]|nr:MAG: hypothetical protein EPN82_05830 [Bacteroidota bacterium]